MMNRSWSTTRASTIVEPTRKQNISRPDMNIHISNHYQSKIYTTASDVSGHVEVNTSRDVQVDNVQILLVGTSRTSIGASNLPQATSHTFLKLMMPIPESDYPTSRCFEAGRTYTIPFHFVIPQHLALNACSHYVPNDGLKDHHLRLPPSVGNWDKDDFAPHMSRITYSVRAGAYREEANGKTIKVMEAAHDIKVVPMVAEDPPLSIAKQDKMYVLSKSKTLRKSILSSKLGRVTVSANQPAPAMMSLEGHCITPTTAQLDLVFEPTSCESQPPKITGVTSKVTAVTCYSTGGINQYPNLKDWARSVGADGRGVYTTSVPLPPAPVGKAEWRQHLTTQTRRDSGYDSELHSDSDHSADGHRTQPPGNDNRKRNHKGAPYYYATKVQVPVQLPAAKKQFIPTFHSCFTSRVYVLWMTVTVSALAGTSSSVTLGVPLQVGVGLRNGSRVDATGLPTFEAAMKDAALEVDAFFQPRTMSVPDVEFRSELPGYSGLSRTRVASVT